ncbi:MAG: organic hydroperoxide resistance protein [Acidobacteria bacterium]|nr:organic hydroperoxide resistance protein [Acidobacteriota bacterium]MBS1866351.1 organic hydroperoxide resistance protein [Acidobacteriota bacterium]
MTRAFAATEASTGRLGKVLYTAKTHSTGGRDSGNSRTDDGRLDVNFTIPGNPGNGTNPEQLFAAAWSTCFLGAIGRAAALKKIALPANVAIDAEVDFGLTQGSHFGLSARLNVSLPGVDREIAQALIDEAHQTCPYSRATRGNIDVSINLI